MVTVGRLIEATSPGDYGFVIFDDQARPCITLIYSTEQDAEDGRVHALEALAKVVAAIKEP